MLEGRNISSVSYRDYLTPCRRTNFYNPMEVRSNENYIIELYVRSKHSTESPSPLVIICCSCISRCDARDLPPSPPSFFLGGNVTDNTYFFQFGSSIFLDYVWDVNKLVTCSKTFRAVILRLAEFDGERGWSVLSLDAENKRCVERLAGCFGGQLMTEYLNNFFSTFPLICRDTNTHS
jgi:hypothetical protein